MLVPQLGQVQYAKKPLCQDKTLMLGITPQVSQGYGSSVVGGAGVEPACSVSEATDFKSVMYTNSIIPRYWCRLSDSN